MSLLPPAVATRWLPSPSAVAFPGLSPPSFAARRLSPPWSLPTLPPLGRGGLLSLLCGGVGGGTTLANTRGWGVVVPGGEPLCRPPSPPAVAARRRRPPSPPAVAFHCLRPVSPPAVSVRRGVSTEFDSGGWAQSLARYCHPSIW